MGEITFSIDINLVRIIQETLSLDIFIETGTFKGDSINLVKYYFKEIYSIDHSLENIKKAESLFKNQPHITLIHQDSAAALQDLRYHLSQPTLFWLDSHWGITQSTTKKITPYPLLNELKAINYLHPKSIIMIDDARLFMNERSLCHENWYWPNFEEIIQTLKQLSANHRIMLLNDCIVFFPEKIKKALQTYANQYGGSWLRKINKNEQYNTLLSQHSIKKVKHKSHNGITIQLPTQKNYIKKILKRVLTKTKKVNKNLFSPRLGKLCHHEPKNIFIPKYYHKQKRQKNFPVISIVTPSFNHNQFLSRTIDSVINQKYPALEYIIQDGGSTDGTLDTLKKYHSVLKHWESVKDNGQSNAINLGFRHATGDIMAYLNSDDILLPGALHSIATYFKKHPHVDAVYGHRILIDCSDKEIGRWILPPHDGKILQWADFIPQETLFWRRQLWEKVGGSIDESFRFAMDWDLLLRFNDVEANLVRLPRFLAAFRIHPFQKTSAQIGSAGLDEMQRLRHRYHGRYLSAMEIKKTIHPYLKRHLIYHGLYRMGLLRY